MELENQVVSLILAKQLQKLETKAKSLWKWTNLGTAKCDKEYPNDKYILQLSEIENGRECYSAYTVAELGEMLPKTVFGENERQYNFRTWSKGGGYIVAYVDINNKYFCPFGSAKEADARAKMLIWLIHNKLITL